MLLGLVRMYGAAPGRRVRRGAGLDTLVEAMLAQNTNMVNAVRGYRMLRRRFATWQEVLAAPVGEVQREIAVCGLARMRARRLQDLLRAILEQRGRLSIDFLARETPEAAFEYLMSFYGIGPKTAAFTLLFGFGHPVLPVDNGVLRVIRRLRLVRAKARDLEAERVLSPLIARGNHYPTHVLLFRHAKERCRVRNPTRSASCSELSEILGTGIPAHEAVPMALYCFLRHPASFPDVLHHAIFIGGDTDTIASMAASLSAALLGPTAIPPRWLSTIREDTYPPRAIESLADRLYEKYVR
jgi:endonuclease-3